MNGACNVKLFLAPPPGEGSKGQISFNFNYKVNLKIFIPNCVCVPTNERYKTYQMGFLFCRLGHALGSRSNIINMSISKIFIPNFVCVLTNKG